MQSYPGDSFRPATWVLKLEWHRSIFLQTVWQETGRPLITLMVTSVDPEPAFQHRSTMFT